MRAENADQKEFWETFAQKWVDQQADLDGLMAPVLDAVLARAALVAGEHVLDIGCGTGTSTCLVARAAGPSGSSHGVDISEPMLARARNQAAGLSNVRFDEGDAADFPFTPASYDAVISRFGVMFFADPEAAFANIRHGMKPGARLTMATWSHIDANPWFQVPMYAAKQHLGAPPPLDPDDPGPFAFRDITRVEEILRKSGFSQVAGEAVSMELTPPGDLSHVAAHAVSIGPALRAIAHFDAGPEDVAQIAERIAEGFAAYEASGSVRVPAEINIFSAVAP